MILRNPLKMCFSQTHTPQEDTHVNTSLVNQFDPNIKFNYSSFDREKGKWGQLPDLVLQVKDQTAKSACKMLLIMKLSACRKYSIRIYFAP
jgi:hypothetical protein